jgi:hypothetical protein
MLLGEIVEIEALRLTIFIVDDFQIGDRLRLYARGIGFAILFALRLSLRFFHPLLLAGTFFLSFRESCTRASCHSLQSTKHIRLIATVEDSVFVTF